MLGTRARLALMAGAAVMVAGTLGPLGAGSPALAAARVSPAAQENAFTGTAFGTEVTLASTVKSGRSALAVLGCTSQIGVTDSNSVNSVAVPGVRTGTITTSTGSETTSTGVASNTTTTVQGVNLLSGMVTATAIQSESTTSRNTASKKFSTSAAGTQFLDLNIGGTPVSGTPPPNTKMNLPSGLGYVILNQQTSHIGTHKASLTVIGIHVVVTGKGAPVPVGTNIIVSYALSDLGGPVSGLLDGQSYGAYAKVAGGAVILGRAFPEYLGCLGTNGATKTNSAASVSIPGALTSGTVTDTAEGVATSKKASAETTATVQNLNIGNGAVTATAVEADVTATGNPPTFGDNSSFVGLEINGMPESGTVPPNTKMPLHGIGTLWLHRVIKSANQITVIMIQLKVTVPNNPTGLSPGTTVNVAYATVSIH